MTDPIEEARALLIAHDEGYRVHVGCGGEVDARTMLCAKCDEAIGVGQFAHPDKLSAAAAGYIRALVADLDRTRAELARVTEERDDSDKHAAHHMEKSARLLREKAAAEAELAAARAELARRTTERDARLDLSPAMLAVVLEMYATDQVEASHVDECDICVAIKAVHEFVDRRFNHPAVAHLRKDAP